MNHIFKGFIRYLGFATEEEDSDQNNRHQSENIKTDFQLDPKVDLIQPKTYELSQIKKELTKKKNEDGLLAAYLLGQELIERHEFEFIDFLSLMKKLVPYGNKESSLSSHQMVDYFSLKLNEYQEFKDGENLPIIGEALNLLSPGIAIDHIHKFIDPDDSSEDNLDLHFHSLLVLSDCLRSNREWDRSFQTLRRANLLVFRTPDPRQFLINSKIINERMSLVCLRDGAKPDYPEFIYFQIVSFLIEISKDVLSFPITPGFFHRKKICFNWEWSFFPPDFDKALKALGIIDQKKDLLIEVFTFAFEEIPVLIGVPRECIKDEVSGNFFGEKSLDKRESQFDERMKFIEIGERIQSKRFDCMPEILTFSSEILSKYYQK